jgi:hypothetical protein
MHDQNRPPKLHKYATLALHATPPTPRVPHLPPHSSISDAAAPALAPLEHNTQNPSPPAHDSLAPPQAADSHTHIYPLAYSAPCLDAQYTREPRAVAPCHRLRWVGSRILGTDRLVLRRGLFL